MTSLKADIAAVDAATEVLLATASRLSDADIGGASLCEGWTRGHVLAHISRNAEAVGRLVDWAVTGERQEMYPGGTDVRDADIEAGSGRGAAAQLADLTATAADLERQLPRLVDGLAVPEVEGRGGFIVPSEGLPFMRLREVVFHHVDLDAGYGFADVDGDLLVRLIDDAVSRLRLSRRAPSVTLRTDQGDTWTVGEGDTEVTGSRAGVLLWLARRVGDGVTSSAGPLPELPRGA
jgi:maleylpyruvate isomerase